ncbi:S-layer homology domain-containing protein [Egicoccus halophilus]|uniref:S-layer homology domain-containing protein n=1 Tax=Egicoccus halophilus TaxID=1670830 RepID=UPI00103271FE|nr:S-layer homology domain-containing protein [Egicoccus halophilus]
MRPSFRRRARLLPALTITAALLATPLAAAAATPPNAAPATPPTAAPATPLAAAGATSLTAGGVARSCPRDVGAVRLADVGAGVHRDNVVCLAAQQVVVGYGDGTFRPTNPVSRAQFATFLHRLVTVERGRPAPAAVPFTDVPAGSTHAEAIGALTAAGIVSGTSATTFAPDRQLNRGQMAALLARTHRHLQPATAGPVALAAAPRDVVGTTFEHEVRQVIGAGIAAGHADGTFRPGVQVTREQMATFLVRLQQAIADPDIPPSDPSAPAPSTPAAPAPSAPTAPLPAAPAAPRVVVPTDGPRDSTLPEPIRDPEALGFPGPSTTGVTDPSRLRLVEGRVNLSRDGEVFENALVRGRIYVTGKDVTIRNVRLETGADWGIHVDSRNGARRLLVVDTEIIGQGDTCIAGIAHGNFTARRVEVTNCDDGMRIGPDTTVEGSFVHGLRKSKGDEHNDALQTTGGSNIRIRNNTLISVWKRQTSSVFLQAIFGPIDNVVVEGNLMSGGTYTVYVENVGEQPGPTNVHIRDNVFVQDSWLYGHRRFRDAQVTWRDNVTSSGQRLS